MSETQGDIYDLKETEALRAQLFAPLGGAAPAPQPPVLVKQRPKNAPAEIFAWLVVANLLILGGLWAYRAGMELRHNLWVSTRTVRFHGDIWNGFRWGNAAMRQAESIAHLPPFSDAVADQTAEVKSHFTDREKTLAASKDVRRLTLHEVLTGIVRFYDDRESRTIDEQYQLDYPPLRLMMMTLFVRSVQRDHPDLTSWQWPQQTEDTPQRHLEDIAQPLLNVNAASSGIAAIAMFFLVWLWTGGSAAHADQSRPAWHWPQGILAFILATGGFWYAFVALAGPPARPSPMVQITQVSSDANSFKVSAIINSQNIDTRWHIDWGDTLTYGKSTAPRDTSTALTDVPITATLGPIEPGQTIHFRLSATSAAGITNSQDVQASANQPPTPIDTPAVGGLAWPGSAVWLRMLMLFAAMVVCARRLPMPHRGWALGAVAAALVWFDPANLVTSHAWPQWDVWIVPVFVAAGLFASLDWWLTAGLTLGIGCMVKGQLLLGAPIFLLWPLFGGRWSAFIRIITGLALGAAFIVWPWIIAPGAARWITLSLLAAILVGAATLLRHWMNLATLFRSEGDKPWALFALAISLSALAMMFASLLIFWKFHRAVDVPTFAFYSFVLAILVVPWILPRRALGYWLISMFTAAIWISAFQFGGDFSWLRIGFAYGTVKFPFMAMGNGDYSNLMAVLAQRYGWQLYDTVGTVRFAFNTPAGWHIGRWIPSIDYANDTTLDVKTCVMLLYAATLILCAIAAAVHSRRKDPRVLAALAAPWILFPLLMGQMSERYLLWGSAASAAFVAISLGTTLLHVLLTLLGAGMTASQLLGFDIERWAAASSFFRRAYPGWGVMITLLAAMFLLAALSPTARKGTNPAPKGAA
ncbi:MAG: hypothetical protein M3O30_16460 [Planctomycetota bacterium]|nr:hypothetical protein [Planctomycetota bacterium]